LCPPGILPNVARHAKLANENEPVKTGAAWRKTVKGWS